MGHDHMGFRATDIGGDWDTLIGGEVGSDFRNGGVSVLDSEVTKPMGDVSGFWLTWYYFGSTRVKCGFGNSGN